MVTAILIAVLAGCSAIDEIAHHLDPGAAATPPAPKVKPYRVSPPPPRHKPKIALAARLDARSGAPREFDLEKLIGLKPAQALAALGKPASVHERSPSMVWRYNVQGCALDLFFYMDLGANAFRVLAYEMKAATSSGSADDSCLGRFRAAANGR
jgi:hypothetical protein